jgi:peptide/nickel transport system permease protein
VSFDYIVKRILLFFLVIWSATTLIFFLPKLAPDRDPIRERMGMMAATGGVMAESIEQMVKTYEARFGLDQPLWKQYLRYLFDIARFDFGYSLSMYPARVIDLIAQALPWTIGLLAVATLISFAIGTFFGGLLAWPRAPKVILYLLPPLFTFSAIPFYLLGLILIYVFAFKLHIFPLGGGSQYGTLPSLNLSFVLDLVHHSILPALSIVVSAVGFWALAMRGMVITVLGEDFMAMAESKGLKDRRIFLQYAMRNALLPQLTSLALSLGTVVSGSLLVEVMFRYPGIGTLLFKAVTGFDYFTIYGVVFFIIITIGLATLILDLTYPLLDPRIRYHRT